MTAENVEGMRPEGCQPARATRGSSRRALWTGALAISATAAIAAGSIAFLAESSKAPGTSRAAKNAVQRQAGMIRLASLEGAGRRHDAEADRTGRIFEPRAAKSGFGQAQGHELAERGGRVFHPAVAETSRKDNLTVAALMPAPPKAAKTILRAIPKALEAKVADEPARAPTVKPRPQQANNRPASGQGALALLAAFDPKPAPRPVLEGTAVAAYQSADVPRPSLRPEIDAEIATEAASPAGEAVLAAVPLPASRPESEAGKEVKVASLGPEAGPGPLGTASDDLTALAVPLPERRPDYTPPVVASPQPQPEQPAQRPAERRAPAVASTRPNVPGQDPDDGRSFFEKLFGRGGSAKLPGPGSGIAVYDIAAATVYLPNGTKLEAHSGLGHMQDNPRYVNQKNRGPTPPNIYNLRMREALFHGAEAVRLLPADGRKKFNRDGLLAHPYMYIGGGDRSQSNGCVVFANYAHFLRAFKAGQLKRMIVVKSLDDLPTYMAAL